MIDVAEVFWLKAEESLAGAESEFANGRYNNCANRCYYACFQAAITALIQAGLGPAGTQGQWSHEFVQAEFVGRLINRRKLYPVELRDTLARSLSVRHEADYSRMPVTETSASRVLRRARQFVASVQARGGAGR